MTDHDNDQTEAADVTITEDEHGLVAEGGWRSPHEVAYGFLVPEVTVQRGGLSFTTPKPLTEWKKKDLVREVERLRESQGTQRVTIRRLEQKNRRLRRAIKRLIG